MSDPWVWVAAWLWLGGVPAHITLNARWRPSASNVSSLAIGLFWPIFTWLAIGVFAWRLVSYLSRDRAHHNKPET